MVHVQLAFSRGCGALTRPCDGDLASDHTPHGGG